MRLPTVFAAIAIALVSAALGAAAGLQAGRIDVLHRLVGVPDDTERRGHLLRHAFGLDRAHALYGQDLWVLHSVFPGVTDGWFVDLGSADGVHISNTKRLEDAGWRGVCIDPFPRNMASRTCRVFDEAVDAEGGRTVQFHGAGSYGGGILEHAGWWVGDPQKRDTVPVRTTTLADVLQRAGAPPFIHYLNVDIEGAEHEALRTFPFDRWRFGAITIEHNNVEARRRAIRELLEANGYRLQWAIRDQDWYLGEHPGTPLPIR